MFMRSACALLVLGCLGAAAATPKQLHYEVLDGDKLVGHLDMSLDASEHGLVVQQRGEIVLHRMMLTAKIHQSIEERWQDQRLLALHSETSSEATIGDTTKSLAVVRDPSGALRATIDGATHDLPADAMPLNIWSARTLVPGPHFGLTDGAPLELKSSSAAEPDETVRYQGAECRRSSFESVNKSKRSVVTAWTGDDDIVCKLRIRAGRDVFTYVRRPAP